MKFEKERIT